MSFKRELDLAIENAIAVTERTWRLSVNEAFVSVVNRTPVDSGAARNSYHASASDFNGGEGVRDGDKSGSESIASINAATSKLRLGGVAIVYNNLPYAERLEDGYSLQAPAGMIKTVEAEWPQIVVRNSRG